MDANISQVLGISPVKPADRPAPPKVEPYKRITATNFKVAYKGLGFNLGMEINPADAMVEQFHTEALKVIGEECAATASALQKVPTELKDYIRTGRCAGIIRIAMLATGKRLQALAQPLFDRIAAAQGIVDAAFHRKPKDPMEALLWFARVSENRRQLDACGKNIGTVMTVALKLANAGDETFVEVFHNALRPYVQANFLSECTAAYCVAVAGPQVEILRQGGEAVTEIRAILESIPLAFGSLASGLGIAGSWKEFTVAEIVKAWPEQTKTAFVVGQGQEAYAALLAMKGDLAGTLKFFRPGLGE